jgi:ATP-dependent Clp protease ATP-binding subunit ClpA
MGADMFERFTDRARRVVVLAQEEARMLQHSYIGTEHLLLGILAGGDGTAVRALDEIGITLDIVRQQVEQIVGLGKKSLTGHIPFTPRAKKVLELSLREALRLGHNYIGTEHILLGIIREGEGVAAQILTRLGDDLSVVRAHVVRLATTSAEAPAETADVAARRPVVARQSGVIALLEDISVRLANIEAHLGIARPRNPRAPGAGAAEAGAAEAGAAETGAAEASAATEPGVGGEPGPGAADDEPDAAEE